MPRRSLPLYFLVAVALGGTILIACVQLFSDRRPGDSAAADGTAPGAQPLSSLQQNRGDTGSASRDQGVNPDTDSSLALSDEEKEMFELADRDPDAAFAKAAATYAGAKRDWWQSQLAVHLIEEDFANTPAVLQRLPQGNVLQSVLMSTVWRAYERDPAGTMNVILTQLTGSVQQFALYNVVRTQVGNGELIAAMHTQLGFPSTPGVSGHAALEIARHVSGNNVSPAVRWWSQLPDQSMRQIVHRMLSEKLIADNDSDGLTTLLLATPVSGETFSNGKPKFDRQRLAENIARIRIANGDEAGLAALRAGLSESEKTWISGVEAKSSIQNAVAGVEESGMSRIPPGNASLDFNGSGIAMDPLSTESQIFLDKSIACPCLAVVSFQFQNGAKTATEYILSQPEAAFPELFTALNYVWSPKDDDALAEWVRALPPGTRREVAIERYVATHINAGKARQQSAREMASLAASPAVRERLSGVLQKK